MLSSANPAGKKLSLVEKIKNIVRPSFFGSILGVFLCMARRNIFLEGQTTILRLLKSFFSVEAFKWRGKPENRVVIVKK